MQALSKRDRKALGICVLFLIAVVIFVMMPTGKPAARGVQLTKAKAEAQLATDKAKYRKLGDDEDVLEKQNKTLAYDQPPLTVTALVVQDLQNIAARSGIHIREIKPLRALKIKSGTVVRVPLEVHFRAAFQPDVVRFLYNVEDPAGKMVVEKMNVTSADARFKTVDVSAQITVFTTSVSGAAGSATGQGDTGNG